MSQPAPFRHASFAGRIGVARREITPPVGIYARNWGAAKHDRAEGIHRPLTATALVLQDEHGGPPLALVSVDLIHGGDPRNPLVLAIEEALGIGPERVMLAFSHTHAGPRFQPGEEDLPGMDLVASYAERLKQQVADAAREAFETAAPATLTLHYGTCRLATNRDLKDPQAERYAVGFHPHAPADDTLLAGRVSDPDGRVAATLVNYACHPTTLAWDNRLISPDWVGAMREVVEAATGGAPCLFLQGASGELAPREQYSGDAALADKNGRQVGYAALAALEDMLPPACELAYGGVVESGAPLAVWQRTASKPSTVLQAERIEAPLDIKSDYPPAAAIRDEMARTGDRAFKERLRRKLALRQRLGDGAAYAAPVWLWRVGDGFLVGQINETYSLFQTELRRKFPKHPLAVMNVVNGSMGYLPPRDLYGLDLYQVWQTPFAAGSLERLIDACGERVGVMLEGHVGSKGP